MPPLQRVPRVAGGDGKHAKCLLWYDIRCVGYTLHMLPNGFDSRRLHLEKPCKTRGFSASGCRDTTAHATVSTDHRWCENPETGCWDWAGYVGTHGYGRVWNGRGAPRLMAHRVVYEELVGPVADDKQLDHLCRNRACVNPAHLEPVTNMQNVQRGEGTKLTPELVREIRYQREARGTTYSDLADQFGISTMQAWKVVKRKSWSNVA